MFDLDLWQEILATVRANKLRTALTGFSVAWGIFMLIVLLGSGQGLAHGVEFQFRDDAINSIWIGAGQTSVPYKGLPPGRDVQLVNADHDELAREVGGVEHITSRFFLRDGALTTYRGEFGSYDVRSVHPGHQHLEKTLIVRGRYLNDLDVAEVRKVAVIGVPVAEELFGEADPLGEYLAINGIPFQVVGIFDDAGGESERAKIYLPISTAQRTFNGADRVGQVLFTTGSASLERSVEMAEEAKGLLANRHRFDPEDARAVWVRNNNEQFARIGAMMQGIRAFVWVVGIGTLLAGVVGVSNILLITVKERTRELGVRKALGATPGSILGLILFEAVLITGLSGYLGLVAGIGVLEAVAARLPADGVFQRPGVDLPVAVAATLLLVLAGVAAGLVPARRAARIRPIEALRDE